MMRRAERPPIGERAAFDLAGDRRDHRHFEQFGRRQRRQDRGQTRSEHRFAGARRSDHQQIVAASRGHFERALGALLAFDVGKIERGAGDIEDLRLRPRQHLRAFEMVGELNQRRGGDDLDIGAGPGRFRPAGRRTHQALAARIGADGGGQHAGDRRDRAVETELAEHGETGQRIVRNGADRRHQSERDRQIVMAAFLGQVGGREIDGDAPRRQSEARGDQRRAHPLARFRDRLVGQAHDVEGQHAGRDLHLHVDRANLDAFERNRGDALDHVCPASGWFAGQSPSLTSSYRKFSWRQEHLENRAPVIGAQ